MCKGNSLIKSIMSDNLENLDEEYAILSAKPTRSKHANYLLLDNFVPGSYKIPFG